MSSATPRKTFIRAPNRRKRDRLRDLRRAVLGALLSPSYWITAHRYRTPGLEPSCERTGRTPIEWQGCFENKSITSVTMKGKAYSEACVTSPVWSLSRANSLPRAELQTYITRGA